MGNLNENGIYGQYNQSIEDVKNIILKNKDLVRFLYYKTIDFDIRDTKKFPYNQTIQKAVRQQILDYNSLEGVEDNTYIIVDMGMATREKRDRLNPDFVNWRALIYLACHDDICKTVNGDRIRCLEQCICDSFTNEDVVKSFGANIGNSQPVSVSEGYHCRVIPIQMVYFNTGRY